MFRIRKNKPTIDNQITVRFEQNARYEKIGCFDHTDRLAGVIALLKDQPDWDYAIDQETAESAALSAADYMSIPRPFNTEQQNLMSFLIERFAGRKIAMFAFGLYADMLGEDKRQVS